MFLTILLMMRSAEWRVFRAPTARALATYFTRYSYDILGRVRTETAPDNSVTNLAYSGFTTSVTNAKNQTSSGLINSQGQLIQSTDALAGRITYSYNPFGNLTRTTDPAGNVTTMTYDLRGRKTAMTDRDMGSSTYAYNAAGELVRQTDAKLQVTNLTYDKLGRILTRTEPGLTSTWTYDTAVKGIGKLTQVSSNNGFARVVYL